MGGWRRDVQIVCAARRVGIHTFRMRIRILRRSSRRRRRSLRKCPPRSGSEEVVGRWGYGSYHNDTDRARTEAAARGQCGQPVVINRGPGGGVLMYLADSAQLQELYLKGAAGGRNFIGPPGPAGGPQDREVVTFDGRVMLLRWMNPEVQTRYGTGVYVRCGAEGMARKPPH